ncbi:MAG: hypothetical protein O2904_01750 [bacterium]|nr:hypothetical protein [bacterium]
MSIALFHRVCVGAFLLLSAILWPYEVSAQSARAYDDTWVVRPIFSNDVLPLQYRSNWSVNPLLNDGVFRGIQRYDYSNYFTRDPFGRVIRTSKSGGGSFVRAQDDNRRLGVGSRDRSFGNPGNRNYGVHVVDETGGLGLGRRGSGVGGSTYGGLNVIDNTGGSGVGRGGSGVGNGNNGSNGSNISNGTNGNNGASGTNGSSSSETSPVDNVQNAINEILDNPNANLNQLRGFGLSDLLRSPRIDFGKLKGLGFDFSSIYRDPNFDLNCLRELGVIRQRSGSGGSGVGSGRSSDGGRSSSSRSSGNGFSRSSSSSSSTGNGFRFGGGSSSSRRPFGTRDYVCNNPEEPGDGKIFGPIPDFSFCGVFGPVPTHEELFGSGFEG